MNKVIHVPNLRRFSEVYLKHFLAYAKAHPKEYGFENWRDDAIEKRVKEIHKKMISAFLKGEANKESEAIKLTCKELGIPHTYKAINVFLFTSAVDRPDAPLKATMLKEVRQAGSSVVLEKGKTYSAWHATNQPDYFERGLLFVGKTNATVLLSIQDDSEFFNLEPA